MSRLDIKRKRLLQLLKSFDSVAVAFSAGVDSTVVAKAAQLALGKRAVAVTADSPSLAVGELDDAKRLASQIGIEHRVIETRELDNSAYTQNQFDRCYHCKDGLYTELEPLCEELGLAVIVNGANVDDATDHRPGMRAAAQHRVRSPLAECELTKVEIRALAKLWNLPVWDKPATPCLSSRVAYGEEVTAERLAMIDRAEQFLRGQGLVEVRVRYHKGDLARIEVQPEDIATLCKAKLRDRLVQEFRTIGFQFVTIDLQGFRSGSLNSLVPVEHLYRSG